MNIHRALNLSLLAVVFMGSPEDVCCYETNPETGEIELVCGEDVLGLDFFPPGCAPPPPGSGDGGGLINTQVIIADLSSPAVPIVTEPDADPKDVTAKRFKKFPGEPAKRLMLKSKRDGAAARLYYDLVFSGSFLAELRIGIDDVANLTDGSSAFFEVAPPSGETGRSVRMTVTWDAATAMLLIGAEDENGPLGEVVPLAPTQEIFLTIWWTTFNGLSLSAVTTEGGFYDYLDVASLPPEDSVVGAFGVESLGKKARFYFSHLSVDAPEMVIEAGVVRAALASAGALKMCEEAWGVTSVGGFPASVGSFMVKTIEALEIAQQELQAAVDSGGPLGAAQVKLAQRSIKQGLKRATASDKLASKLTGKKKPSNKALDKRVNRTRWACRLLLAQLYGFKSKSIDKLFDTVIFDL